MLRAEIVERAAASGLLDEAGASNGDEDGLARLDAYLCDVKELRIADGLHVLGRAPAGRTALLEAVGVGAAEALDASAGSERAAMLGALDGRFVQPGPAGAPSRGRADVLPTGRNLTSVDPRMVPTPSALRLAERNAAALLARHGQETGEPLRRLVLDLWGSASLRTGGEDFALGLVLMGVVPVWDEGSGRVSGVEVLPLALLDRPRVDVTLRISGVFRDAFAGQVALFDRAVRMLAERDEAAEDNPLSGVTDRLRVFGPEPGRYGTGADWLAGSGFGFGAGVEGVAAGAALAVLAGAADAFVHQQDHRETDILDGPEHAALEGGFAMAAREAGGAPALYHLDIADGVRVRTVAEEVRRVVRGRLANPVWLAGMRRHGFRGASEMARGVEALADFSRALPERFDGSFDLVAAALLGDEENRAFLAGANSAAFEAVRRTLGEVRDGGLWRSRRNDVGELVG
jgi:cobaltochelatase CobN